jgi:hypothetical protein
LQAPGRKTAKACDKTTGFGTGALDKKFIPMLRYQQGKEIRMDKMDKNDIKQQVSLFQNP